MEVGGKLEKQQRAAVARHRPENEQKQRIAASSGQGKACSIAAVISPWSKNEQNHDRTVVSGDSGGLGGDSWSEIRDKFMAYC
ncbi:hypothetical protein L2E82_31287 [Cichorium intybus]|uniref:Uncharacterized protein n=1 Tax=Cichorium intybus TaxID=13427 RepID=A0ACB9D2G2_CICIN|nr:hypothetical protein L2E82_31287 [Cichorium intybus]